MMGDGENLTCEAERSISGVRSLKLWAIAKTIILLIAVFIFVIITTFIGYFAIFGYTQDSSDVEPRALLIGCALGLAIGTLIGFSFGKEQTQQSPEEELLIPDQMHGDKLIYILV